MHNPYQECITGLRHDDRRAEGSTLETAQALSARQEALLLVSERGPNNLDTLRIDFIRADRLTVPDLAAIVPGVYNSKPVKSKATEQDPCGLEYTNRTP